MTSPTRSQNILAVFLTSNPTLGDKTSVLSGLSAHDIVMAEVNVKPKIIKQVARNILLYKKADWAQLKESMRDFHKVLMSDFATADVQLLWDEFDTFIPVRKAKSGKWSPMD